jgi:hypothetical protein
MYLYDTLLERLPQDLKDVAAELGQFIQEEHAVVRQRDLAGRRHVTPADQSGIRDGLVGGAKRAGRHQRLRPPVRPATLWIRVVSMASARVMAGRIVVRRRASIDVPVPGGPRRRILWAERLRHVHLHLGPWPRPKRSLLMGRGLAECAAPRTDRFLGHPDPACLRPPLALAAGQARGAQAPDGMTAALGWTSVMYVGGGGEGHDLRLSHGRARQHLDQAVYDVRRALHAGCRSCHVSGKANAHSAAMAQNPRAPRRA